MKQSVVVEDGQDEAEAQATESVGTKGMEQHGQPNREARETDPDYILGIEQEQLRHA